MTSRRAPRFGNFNILSAAVVSIGQIDMTKRLRLTRFPIKTVADRARWINISLDIVTQTSRSVLKESETNLRRYAQTRRKNCIWNVIN